MERIEKLINQVFYFLMGVLFLLFLISGIVYLVIDDLVRKLGDWCS